ncbi:MAG: hypothetical protein WD009_07030 [Phycisphaeraceae bacterium]
MVACDACGHRYRVGEAHVRHRRPGPEPQPAQRTDALHVPGHAAPGHRRRVDAEGNVIGLSGLSEMMRRESAAVPAANPDEPLTPAAPRTGNPSLARRVIVVAAVAMLGVGSFALGLLVWQAVTRAGAAASLPGLETTPLAEMPEIYGIPLAWRDQPWQRAPTTPATPTASAADADEQPVEANSGDTPQLNVRDVRIQALPDGRRVLRAVAVRDGGGPVAAATVHLTLMDGSDRMLGRIQVRLAMLGPAAEQRLCVAVPGELASAARQIEARIELDEALPRGRPLDARFAGHHEQHADHAVHVRLRNDSDQPVSQLVVLVAAADEQGWPLVTWRAKRRERIEPGDWAEFMVRTPIGPGDHFPEWHVEASGW